MSRAVPRKRQIMYTPRFCLWGYRQTLTLSSEPEEISPKQGETGEGPVSYSLSKFFVRGCMFDEVCNSVANGVDRCKPRSPSR